MLEFPRWKYVLILVVLVVSAIYALPNIYPQDPSVQITASRGAAIDDALRAKVDETLKAAGVTPKQIEKRDGDLLVRLSTPEAQAKANDALRESLGENYTPALNLASTVPAWLSGLHAKPMVRGLDLQGGVHFTLQVDQKAALDKRVEAYAEDARVALRDAKIRVDSVLRGANNTILVNVADGQSATAARDALMKVLAPANATASGALVGASALTYDVQGQRIVIGLPESELTRISGDAIQQNIATLRNRVNQLGVAEPVIQQQGSDRIVVELPGVQDTAAAKRMIGATATIEFRAVVEGDALEAMRTGNVPPEAKLYQLRDNRGPVLLNKRVLASGDQMVNAVSNVDQNGQPAVDITLNSVAGQRMFDFTSVNVGKRMAVVYIERIPEVKVVDGKEVRSVRVSEEALQPSTINGVFSNKFQTTGLTKDEADNLAKLLRAGSLAAPMSFVEEYVIGPSLGAENVERGIKAVVYSFLFTLVFFTIYYRVFGAITSVALLFNLLIVVAVMSIFGATMTLPGFAGLALSVGLSVDANVLVNERIREELRLGVPGKKAIAEGYERASGTILDANLTGLIVGVALFAFGTGPLKGFALTMMIGIIASMFTAITVSRALATLIYGRRKKLNSVAI
ncbi:protein translocase subunit SecD [Pseudoxanthomonas winnipegensis]|jgi:preprotein translocase subunit SecD|uniref:Protein translocase subunit SecD n=1 Tax=Pseudoxanthomonas winnipegensis TaxID=2480810 RepID=A0A4Q8L9E5_9GAMM|nr:protein translocase subunit SecD [Pseudoxanthomonas winnipegensis]PZP62288.1 MAG: protein translocase subunit SecD [Pseudoxanthomonas spadix]TAA24526.1 protein translocase subunit SecD [Pseudoxanthomonas winnipegensis]